MIMDLAKINRELRASAVQRGLCVQWQSEWSGEKSIAQLCEMYKKGIDFCIDWPKPKVLRKLFSKDEIAGCGVFLDQRGEIELTQSGVYVVVGKCDLKIIVPDYIVATIHVLGNDSAVTVQGCGMSKTFLRIYGSSAVNWQANGLSTIRVRKVQQKAN